MSRKLVIDSEAGHVEIEYSALSLREINRRIDAFEKKYQASFARFNERFCCDSASQDEMTDVMDWECLIEEKAERTKTATNKPAR